MNLLRNSLVFKCDPQKSPRHETSTFQNVRNKTLENRGLALKMILFSFVTYVVRKQPKQPPLRKSALSQATIAWFAFFMAMTAHGLTTTSSDLKNPSPLQANHKGEHFPETNLKVGVLTIWPYGSLKQEQYNGLAYDIWSVIASENNFHSTYVSLGTNIDEAINKVAAGEIDIAVGPIAILSERILRVDFTQPFYLGEFVLVGKKISLSIWQRFNSFFGNKSPWMVLALIVIYFLYLNIYWIYERETQPALKGLSYKKSMHTLLWQSILAQRGKHPYFPETSAIKLLSLLWNLIMMSFLISVFAGLSASFIAHLKKDQILFNTIKDVGKKPIAVFGYAGTINDAKEAGLNVVASSTSIDGLMEMLDSGKVSGIFMPFKLALTYIDENKNEDLYVSPIKFHKLHLGFATGNSIKGLLPRINSSLLRMSETGKKMQLCEYYKKDLLVDGCN